MTVTNATLWRSRLYPRWLELLRQEIELVGTQQVVIIPLGGEAERYLTEQTLPRSLAPKAMHYSQTAVRWRSKLPDKHPEEFAIFCQGLERAALEASVEERLRNFFGNEVQHLHGQIPELLIQSTLSRLKTKDSLTESRKQLMFTYFKQFETLRTGTV